MIGQIFQCAHANVLEKIELFHVTLSTRPPKNTLREGGLGTRLRPKLFLILMACHTRARSNYPRPRPAGPFLILRPVVL